MATNKEKDTATESRGLGPRDNAKDSEEQELERYCEYITVTSSECLLYASLPGWLWSHCWKTPGEGGGGWRKWALWAGN